MKCLYKNKIFTMIFLFSMVFSFVALNGCARLNQGSAVATGAKKEGKEILVAEDIGGGLPFSLIRWCGNAAFLIYGGESGTEWVDLNGNKVTVSTKGTDYPIDCSPDGGWVIYNDRKSAREYRDNEGRTPENIVDEGPGWHGLVSNLYRYQVASGRRQIFAVVRDDSGSLFSHDGSKVLLGNRHDSIMEMPEPKWETVWLSNEWLYGSTYWFADSSGVVTGIWGNGASLGVEIFGENGWAKEFSLKGSVCGREEGCNVVDESVDNEKRFYLLTGESFPVAERMTRTKYLFFLCRIENRELLCEQTGELMEHENRFAFVKILSDGNIIFKREEDGCIRRLKQGQTDAKCIADTRYGDDAYKEIRLVAVSPDGRRLAFRRGKTPPKPGGRFYAYQYDLFVKDLSED